MASREVASLGTVTEYDKASIEVKKIELADGSFRYNLRKYFEGEQLFKEISIDQNAARWLYFMLGKELGYLPDYADADYFSSNKKCEFSITEEQIKRIKVIERPINTKDFVKNINQFTDRKAMKLFSATSLQKWLVVKGYMQETKERQTVNRTVRKLTSLSGNIGLFEGQFVDAYTGEVKSEIQLTAQAQRYILDNLQEIIKSL